MNQRTISATLIIFLSFLPGMAEHQLTAEFTEPKIFTLEHKSEFDSFLDGLDRNLVLDLSSSRVFEKKIFQDADSANLASLGYELLKRKHNFEAEAAFKKALSLNSDNLNAQLGLAISTQDFSTRLEASLATIPNQSLLEIADAWFEQALVDQSPKTLNQAFVVYQFTILKNPSNPEFRFRYAKALEEGGAEFLEQAAKRYLEAAALAKSEYLKGNKVVELLLREASESLIRVNVLRGDFTAAAKYCLSYISLGFKDFPGGLASVAVLKELELKRNPFMRRAG